jgi:hypothetical protein
MRLKADDFAPLFLRDDVLCCGGGGADTITVERAREREREERERQKRERKRQRVCEGMYSPMIEHPRCRFTFSMPTKSPQDSLKPRREKATKRCLEERGSRRKRE